MTHRPDLDQVAAAAADAALHFPKQHSTLAVSGTEESPMVKALQAVFAPDMPCCSHLLAIPLQPSTIEMTDYFTRCAPCAEQYRAADDAITTRRECKFCGAHYTGRVVILLRVGHRHLAVHQCRACLDRFTRNGHSSPAG